jgi:hypothetical protein
MQQNKTKKKRREKRRIVAQYIQRGTYGLMNTGKALDNDGTSSKEAGLKSSMLATGSFTVVLFTKYNPVYATIPVGASNVRDSARGVIEAVGNLIHLAVVGINGTNEHVVGDVLEVTTVFEPRASHGNVVGGALALNLDKNKKGGRGEMYISTQEILFEKNKNKNNTHTHEP